MFLFSSVTPQLCKGDFCLKVNIVDNSSSAATFIYLVKMNERIIYAHNSILTVMCQAGATYFCVSSSPPSRLFCRSWFCNRFPPVRSSGAANWLIQPPAVQSLPRAFMRVTQLNDLRSTAYPALLLLLLLVPLTTPLCTLGLLDSATHVSSMTSFCRRDI